MHNSDMIIGTEDHFWSKMKNEQVQASYGADVDGTLMEEDQAGSWMFTKLVDTTFLEHISNRINIPGISKPYLYFGSYPSLFPWQTEDINLYSINFLHYGAPKVWYGIPPRRAAKFEAFTEEAAKIVFSGCDAPMRHKPLVVIPSYLKSHGIDVYKVKNDISKTRST